MRSTRAAAGKGYRAYVATYRGAAAKASQTVTFQASAPVVTAAKPDVSTVDEDGKIALEAATERAVDRVVFFVDGRRVGEDLEAPWSFDWVPERGEHDLAARAFGPGGTALSKSVMFNQPATMVDEFTGLPDGFGVEYIQDGFDLPTTFATADAGHIFVAEKSGIVKVFGRDEAGGYTQPRVVIDIRDHVLDEHDRGMTGLAIDPRFHDGHMWIYVSYVFEDGGGERDDQAQQVQRFDLAQWNGESESPLRYDSDNVVLGRTTGPDCYLEANIAADDCVPLHGSSHAIADLDFDPEGNLLVGIGDGAFVWADIADRPQSLRSQDVNVLAAKLLRIDPDTGRGVEGNPFFDGSNSNASRVLAYGLRNPFRIDVRGDGLIVVGDVGEGSSEEINVIDPHDDTAANFGWPCYEGTSRAVVPVSDGPTPDPEANPWDLCRNLWDDPNETVDPAYSYPHAQGASITGGVFYTGEAYPQEFRGSYFFGDYAQNFIRTARIGVHGEVASVEPFAYRSAAGGPVKFGVGPDGTIWYVSIYTGSLRRITYNGVAPIGCPINSFATSYFNLDDPETSLANSPDDYEPGWGWLRFAEVVFPVEPASVEAECSDAVHLEPTSGSIGPDTPEDRAGVRWQGRVRMDEAGTYQFNISGRDWVRVWVDDVEIHSWFAFGGWANTIKKVVLPAGIHNIRVELIHDTGEASADVSWDRLGTKPDVTTLIPGSGYVHAGPGPVDFEVTAAADSSTSLTEVEVVAELMHVTGDDYHRHPHSEKKFAVEGGDANSTGSFALDQDHAPGASVFRIRSRATDANGSVGFGAPVYICLPGNAVGICATS